MYLVQVFELFYIQAGTEIVWKYFGVICNVITVVLGSSLGLLLKRRAGKKSPAEAAAAGKYPPRENLPDTMMVCLGFCSVFAAASGLLEVTSGVQALICVGSMAGGLLIGWVLRLDDRLNRMGDALLEKIGGAAEGVSNPAEGFVTACLLFCIGSMTVLGSFESAANPADHLALECHTMLLIKSLLDFVSSTCLSVTYGVSVMASAAFVLVLQGALVALASVLQPFLERTGAMPAVNCVGSMIILTIAVNLIGLKKIKTADYLPALFLPILVCWLLTSFGVTV